jgi:hypothetical protein
LVALFAVVWWLLPELLYRQPKTGPEARLKAITDTRTALLAGLLGLAAILTFRLNSRGQMTDRHTKAIKQLGSDNLDVLGGIYALEHIAVDSPCAPRAWVACPRRSAPGADYGDQFIR